MKFDLTLGGGAFLLTYTVLLCVHDFSQKKNYKII